MLKRTYLKLVEIEEEQARRHLDEVRSVHGEMRGYKHDLHHHLQTLKGQLEACVPEGLSLSDVELSTVVGNLLDNAIEACRAAEGERFIRLSVRIKGKMMYFYMLNAAGKKKVKVGSLFKTAKVGAHGFGLHRAEAILEAHGGWVKFNSEDGAFTSEFLVPVL